MGFASASILISVNGDTPVAQWRQDCVAGSVVTVALSDNIGANTYRWRLIGRPEGSTTAGTGPEPLSLGTAAVAAFTIDIQGTYVVECLVNGGAPDAIIIVGGVAYLETFTNPLGLLLRLLGPGETSEDNADPQIAQGWIKMLNRWLKVLRAFVSQAALFLSDRIPLPNGVGASGTGNEATRWDHVHPLKPVPVLTTRYYLTGNPSDTSGDYLFSTIQPAPADLQPPSGSTYPIIQDSPVGDPGIATWPAGVVMAHIVARVLNAHGGGMSYPMSFGTSGEGAAILGRVSGGRGGLAYQTAPWPDQPLLTSDYQTFVVPLYVQSLDGSAGDRLRAWFRCNPTGGTITDEQFEIHLSDSYLDTLFPPSDGGTGGDTYKVKRDVDATPVYGDQLLVSPNGSLSLVNDPESDSIDIQVVCSSDLPLPDDPVASAGDPNDRPASIKHVHSLVPASTNGSKLWTGLIPALGELAAVDCVFSGGLGGNSGWSQRGTGVWQSNGYGGIPPIALDSAIPFVGMRVLDAVDGVEAGIYVLTDTGQDVVTANTPYYIQADGSLALTPPTTSGNLTATVSGQAATIEMQSSAIGLTTWPGGTVPVTVTAWITGGSGDYTFGFIVGESIALDRGYAGGGGSAYSYSDHAHLPSTQAITSTPQQFTFNVPVTGTSSANLTDWLMLALTAHGNDGAVLHIGYDPSQSGAITTLFTTTFYHFAVLQRSSDANATADFSNGMYVLVNGGSTHAGQTWGATLPSPFELDVSSQSWTQISPPTSTPLYQLLTAAQLGFTSPNTGQASAAVSSTTGEVVIGSLTFDERTADLAGTTIPATGVWRSHLPLSLGGDLAANTVVKAYAKGALDGTWHLVGTTSALHSAGPGVFIAVGAFGGAGYSMGGAEPLQMQFTASTDSTDGVTVAWTYNDPTHQCYIEVPMVLGFSGTDNHQDLIKRGVFLVAGNETKYGHPQSYIEPGRVHSPYGDLVTTVGGVFTAPRSNSVQIDGNEDFIGIDLEATGSDPWLPGDRLWVHYASARNVVAMRTVPSGCGALWFNVPPDPSDPSGSSPTVRVGTGSVMCFVCNGTLWVAATPPAFGNIE